MPDLPPRWLRAALQEARHLPSASEERLSAWLDIALRRAEDLEFGASFARRQPVEGAAPRDYLHRRLALPGFGEALLGIRFRGGDRAWPFVEILAWEALPADSEGWRPAARQIAASFSRFRPRAARLLLAEAPPLPEAEPDLLVVTGDLAALPREEPALPPGLSLRPSRPEDAGRVAAAYAEVPEELRPHLAPAAAEDLEPPAVGVCLEGAGGEAGWAGLAAARPGSLWALQGFEVVEEVLAPAWRGRGLGEVLQRALIGALPREGGALFGTIHGRNRPSRGVARACGRREVAAWWMLPLPLPATGR